ncbi:energy-coupling factor transporter ATPase [Collinsella tanakaei]|uniref:energy-coupling factor transporter ATPase n=1 Tax=Collinsella tanakaei TaxID=626935 RepID=UPI0025A44687|nr:energy-coupling factor transporter ATPase [Collinsella tanakaei]MDM8300163.1 energy-coupling factor transporter ATPase [Collinsella tanakaei]
MIACENVCYSYDGRTRALDGVSLTVADGEFLCILGGNGSGKSTLAKHLNALLIPDEGRVVVDGLDTADPEYVYDIRSRVGYVFQNPDDQIVATLVEDDVAFGPENLGVDTEHLEGRVAHALEGVGLTSFERRETHALSGGQKQRVAIAGVLAMQPQVLVFDEATSMLDPRGRSGLLRVCRELRDRGMTIVMITHFMEEAAAADRVVVLNEGRIALEGTPQEVLTRADDLERLNLEVPPACRLALALCRRGLELTPAVDENEVVHAVEQALGHAGPARASERSDAADGECASPHGAAADTEAGTTAESCLSFEHVSYSYERSVRERARRRRSPKREKRAAWGANADAVWALHNVDLAVRRGEFLGLAGHTGSGKSTLIQHMNGLVHPTMGRVRAFGRDLADRRGADGLTCKVGLVFQYPEHQLFAPTVFEDVAFGPRNLGCTADEVDERVRRALGQVGLAFDRIAEKSPFALSGGQQRRVAFAGVLAMEPEVLVLDEPAAGLDPAARREFLDLVAELHRSGLTVVMASHSMDDLAALCDRIVVMNEGEVLMQGTASEVFARGDELHRVGLGQPAAQRMAVRLAADGVPVRLNRLYDLDALADELAAIAGSPFAGDGKGGAR